MDRQAPSQRISSPLELPSDEDVMQLVDRWMQSFDGDAGDSLADPEMGSPSALDTMRADWSRFARADTEHSTPEPTLAQRTIRDEQLPLKANGLLITFLDSDGGSISLSQIGGRLRHLGSVAPRGSCASVETACREIGLPEHVTRGFEFIASWFGLPFDAANVRSAHDQLLSWGFWGLSGRELAECLQQWKRLSPDTFANYLTSFGIDVVEGPALSVRSDKQSVQGRAAEWSIATEPRLLAALARSGRVSAAQKAQVDVVLAHWVTPAMFRPWNSASNGDLLTVDVLKSARHVAVLLYLVRRHGRRAAARLLRRVHERYRPHDDGDAWLTALVRSLTSLNRDHDACDVLRIASSPELHEQ